MIQLFNGDCLEVMQELPDNSIDFILTDLPYGTTASNWDKIIPNNLMWEQLKRIRKERTTIALFGTEPFSTYLKISNINEYKYDWIWDKKIPSGMSYAKYQPMRLTENISIFYIKTNYYPQMIKRDKPIKSGGTQIKSEVAPHTLDKNFKKTYTHKNPTNILSYQKIRQGSLHPTQKPVELLEYLIKTYTLENETVLDFTMGSGSTGVACINTNRDFIGIELDRDYFDISENRIQEASKS
jgi:site-specific DNA-methyltransferase (adenine-specific)